MTSTPLVNDKQGAAYQFRSLVDALRYQAAMHPDRKVYSFLQGESIADLITLGELDLSARRLAACLQERKAEGGRALLLYPAGVDFIVALLGCLYAQVTAVPAALPHSKRRYDTVSAIAKDCQAAFILTTSTILESLQGLNLSGLDAGLTRLATDAIDAGAEAAWRMPGIEPETLAYLQYTSGSTSVPKGVMVRHGNVLHNLQYIDRDFQLTPDSVSISWLPHFHDMGLLFNVLQPIFSGFHCYLMSPVAFLQQPMQWLRAISLYKATHSGGPNFAYELCVQKSTEESRESLRLDHWKVAFNGAEPVRAETLERFATMYAPHGFRKEAFYPAYGLAEATLKVSGRFYTGDAILSSRSVTAVEPAPALQNQAPKSSRALIACGQPACDMNVAIVDPERRTRLGPGQTGEIWVCGPSIAKGYWNKPKETEDIFRAHLCDDLQTLYLRTGDLGFLHNDELFITGRLKDLIIIRGQNYYAEDIESSVDGCHPSLRKGGVVAFSVDVEGEEKLVIIQELVRHHTGRFEDMFEAIRAAAAQNHHLPVHTILLVKIGIIPKTSSGKTQRRRCRELLLAGRLDEIASSTLPEISAEEELPSLSHDLLSRLPDAERLPQVTAYARGLVARMLKVNSDQIAPDRALVSFGLDSMMAAQLSIRLQKDLGVSLQPVEFLSDVNLDEVANRIINTLGRQAGESHIDDQPDNEDFALSYGQKALWYQYELAPQSAAYNIARAIRLPAELDTGALQRTCQKLLERHASLRTAFFVANSEIRQRVLPNVEVPFEIFDASTWAEGDLNARMQEEADRPFNLRVDLPVRFKLFQSGAAGNILLMVFHHIVVDFWSLAILIKQLGESYTAESIGQPIDLAAPACDYKDYVRWQEQGLSGDRSERLRTYWLENLAGDLPLMDISSRRRPATPSFEGASHFFKLSPQTLEGVKQLCRVYATTPNMVLLAVFQILLHRYSGHEDIIVGSPTAGRLRAELAETIGYFVNPVPIRANLSVNPTFAAFLNQVRQKSLEALEHQEYPFTLLVDGLQTGRDVSRSPIFQVMFLWQKPPVFVPEDLALFALGASGAAVRFGELAMESVALQRRISQFDLTLTACEAAGELVCNIEYSTDLFDEQGIRRLADHYANLLEHASAGPDRHLSELNMLGEPERQLIVTQWNETQKGYDFDSCIHRAIEAWAKKTPEAPAVLFNDQCRTYRELNSAANELAAQLIDRGVQPCSFVPILMEQGIELVTAMLAVMKAGAAFSPLDTQWPDARIEQSLAELDGAVILTDTATSRRAAGWSRATLVVDAETSSSGQADPDIHVNEDDPIYVIYTSGSTGRPKGVVVPHKGVMNRFYWMNDYFGGQSARVVLQTTRHVYDSAVWQLFWPLTNGGRTVITQPGAAITAQYMTDLIAQHAVTMTDFVPSIFNEIVPALVEQGKYREALASIRDIILGGEEIVPSTVYAFLSRFPGVRITNLYGPTEASIGCIYYQVSGTEEGRIPIGRPIANVQVLLLDRYGDPVPVGVAGEVHLTGTCLALGYLNNERATRAAFIANPFTGIGSSKLYRTGDSARYAPDGNIEFLGRVDDQIKIRGLRIEPGEVEAGLHTFPGVKQVKVLAREDRHASKQLAAYLILEPQTELSVSALRSHLKGRLPESMIPEVFTVVEQWPVTASGKLDRHALFQIEPLHWSTENSYVAPHTETQARLAEIFTEVLGLERVGINDGFFELGGNSLLAMRIVSRIKSALQVDVSLIDLIAQAPTVAALTSLIEQRILDNASTEEMLRALEEINRISQ